MKFLNDDTLKVGLEMGSEMSTKAKTERTSEELITLESLKAAAQELQQKSGVRQSGIKICSCNTSVSPEQSPAKKTASRRR
jgi:hypothetical protein